ncbi:MAG: HAMP domain-containing sensor histidine kinase [Acidimicrobiia bacterium]|nr:HAMP domain-containing sensor histidine kinase [Acidimicrobiia bacterium]MDX2466006.1 HAMP domain-containing sensor histidine kinase [Acidimicrobiia bacterium]
MDEGRSSALKKVQRSKRKGNRAWIITTAAGTTLLIVSAIVFAVSSGTRGLTAHAEAVHIADETLRVATVARAQVSMANHFASIERELAVTVDDQLAISASQARSALDLMASGIEQLKESGGDVTNELSNALNEYVSLSTRVLDLIEAGRSDEANEVIANQIEAPYALAFALLQQERDSQLAEVASSDESMAKMGTVAQVLLALLIPGGMIIMYRELTLRLHRQAELRMRLDAERAVGKVREDFVANASHELRTPLTIVYGMAQVIEDHPEATEDVRELATTITNEAEDLYRMVEDLLTTSQLDADALKYVIEDVNTAAELKEVVAPMTRSGGFIETTAEEATVLADRMRQRQVLRNLISNARKYGGPELRITGSIEGDMYEWVVSDNGKGIPADIQDRLFQRFVHRGSLVTAPGGVGIGLSIVRALVEGMGGTISYAYEQGWTKFRVRVPLAEIQAVAVAPTGDEGDRLLGSSAHAASILGAANAP